MTFTERPILFSGPMVRAILDGRKSQTRRVVKPTSGPHTVEQVVATPDSLAAFIRTRCPYGVPGDRLWVRETWGLHDHEKPGYKATATDDQLRLWKWKPSIHMPRKYSRLTLEVLNVRVERLQEIGERDAVAEGLHSYPHFWRDPEYPLPDVAYEVNGMRYSCPTQAFQALWDSINAKRGYGWDANPWVWCVTFKPISPTAGAGG